MSLTTHNYRYFTDPREFWSLWGATMQKLEGDRVIQVWAVWDKMGAEWFENAPMLVQLSSGTLSVSMSCENQLAVGWNDILCTDRPVWIEKEQRVAEKMEWWTEDLCWREYSPVRQAFGGVLKEIVPHTDSFGLRGLNFLLESGDVLRIENTGDAIAGRFAAAPKI